MSLKAMTPSESHPYAWERDAVGAVSVSQKKDPGVFDLPGLGSHAMNPV